MIKLLAVIPQIEDGTSFYRGIRPLQELARKGDIELTLADSSFRFDWWDLPYFDVVFLQRPSTNTDIAIAQRCGELGVKVWCDWDDDLLNIDPLNPAFGQYQEVEGRIKSLLSYTNLVTVSTENIKKNLSPYHFNIEVVPNGLDTRIWGKYPKPSANENIIWRGADNHFKSLIDFQGAIADSVKESGWNFIAFRPMHTPMSKIALQNVVPRTEVDFVGNVREYSQKLRELNSRIAIVPMHDCEFNRSKSNISWMEHTMAGSVVVAPNWDEFKKPGVVNYDSVDDFKSKLFELTQADDDYLDEMNEKSFEYIKENLTLEHTNKLRSEILKELVN